jgi:hypothetical protein
VIATTRTPSIVFIGDPLASFWLEGSRQRRGESLSKIKQGAPIASE